MPPRGRLGLRSSTASGRTSERRAASRSLGEGVGWQRAVMDERVGVGERELHRLDLEVRARLETVVQSQREQRRNPLAVRRQLAHLDAAIAPAQRLDPLGGMGVEIVLGEPGRRGDRRRDLSLVESIRPLRRDPLQGGGELGELVALADGGRRPRGVAPPVAHLWAIRAVHTIAVAGSRGGGRDCAVEAEAAEVRGQIRPEPDGTGDGHRARADVLGGPATEVGRRPAGAVEAVQRALVPDEREGVTADAVVGRLRDRQHRSGGERRVDRVPAALERAQAGARRERMARRHHRLGADRRHSPPAARFGAARLKEGVEVELHHPSIAGRGAGRAQFEEPLH